MNVKILCLNLWQGGNLIDNILSFIAEHDADILMLQEVYAGTDPELSPKYRSMEILARALPRHAFAFEPAMLDRVPEGKVEAGNAVFSRLPLLSSNAQFFNEPYRERDALDPAEFPTAPRNLQHVVVEAGGRELNIFNFHGVYDLDGDNFSPKRRHMSELIIRSVQGKSGVVLAGDTNARTTNRAMVAVAQHLDSVFGHELASTFNMRRKTNPGYATSSVDMMFVSPDLKVVSKLCPNVDISDHLPLVVELQV